MDRSSDPVAANPVLSWLQTRGTKYRETLPFVEGFVSELLRAGIDMWRLTTGIHILHPQIDASSCLWERGKPVTERRFRLSGGGLQQLQNSPMLAIYGGKPVRYNLETGPQPGEFPILAELRGDAATEYFGLPLPFSDGSWKAITYTTKRPGGFSDEQVAVLESLVPTLAMILEIQTLQRTTLTLLDTYVGATAGRRVLDGVIKRGMSETIKAVILFCDLRGFTELSERLPGEELVSLLNEYFGAMTDSVERHGGEVLKFIGDALLAIFPLAGEDGRRAAGDALLATQEADASIAALSESRLQAGRPAIRFGLALHVGEVLYGNIGGADRLDFTVVGQAVNVATRIESLCKTLDRHVLLSGEFAALCNIPVEPIGTFALKGVGTEQPVYAPMGVNPA